jgi:hypothetical protein
MGQVLVNVPSPVSLRLLGHRLLLANLYHRVERSFRLTLAVKKKRVIRAAPDGPVIAP